jgi:hypothetical protein
MAPPRNDSAQAKPAKSHRQRQEYEFDPAQFANDFPPTRAGAKPPAEPVLKLAAYLSAWMRDLKAWGEDVRDDIIRVETAVHVAPGDPGDPPPAPRAK